jgi:hypothetical protein
VPDANSLSPHGERVRVRGERAPKRNGRSAFGQVTVLENIDRRIRHQKLFTNERIVSII